MGSKVTVTAEGLTAKIKNATVKGRKALAEQILSDSTQYVPKAENILRNSPADHIEDGGDRTFVVWDTPYAAYQFYGCWPDGSHQIHNHTTPGTTTFWVLTAHKKNRDKWLRVAQEASLL